MKMKFFYLSLLTVACGEQSSQQQGINADLYSISDADLIEAAEGGFNVTCKDGKKEFVTQEQMSNDEVCLHMNPKPKPGKQRLCGTYDVPISIKEGAHIVTCDVKFLKPVIIHKGAKILADDHWKLEFKSDLFAYGTEENPIIFDVSEFSESKTWKYIKHSGNTPVLFQRGREYKQGSIMKHVHFYNTNSLNFYKMYATDNKFFDASVKFEGFVSRSEFLLNRKDLSIQQNSYFVHNKVEADETWLNNSFVAWNEFLKIRGYFGGANYFVFNNIKTQAWSNMRQNIEIDNIGYDGKEFNESKEPQKVSKPQAGPNTPYTLVGPFPFKAIESYKLNIGFKIPLLIADKTGWRFDLQLYSQMYSKFEGEVYHYGKVVGGYYPQFKVKDKESYSLQFKTAPSTPIISPVFRMDFH